MEKGPSALDSKSHSLSEENLVMIETLAIMEQKRSTGPDDRGDNGKSPGRKDFTKFSG
jgi:hypothetical protein